MNRSMIRANLSVTSAVELTDPSGDWWTVYVMRTGDPHDPMVRNSNMYGMAVALNRLRRLLTRERTWDVELLKGTGRGNLSSATLMAREPSKADALTEAEAIAIAVGSGEMPTGQPM